MPTGFPRRVTARCACDRVWVLFRALPADKTVHVGFELCQQQCRVKRHMDGRWSVRCSPRSDAPSVLPGFCSCADGAHCDPGRQTQDKGGMSCRGSSPICGIACAHPLVAWPSFCARALQRPLARGLLDGVLTCANHLHSAFLGTSPLYVLYSCTALVWLYSRKSVCNAPPHQASSTVCSSSSMQIQAQALPSHQAIHGTLAAVVSCTFFCTVVFNSRRRGHASSRAGRMRAMGLQVIGTTRQDGSAGMGRMCPPNIPKRIKNWVGDSGELCSGLPGFEKAGLCN